MACSSPFDQKGRLEIKQPNLMEDVDFMTRTPSLPQFPIWQCEKTGKIVPRVIDFGSEVAIAILARALKVKIDESTYLIRCGTFNTSHLSNTSNASSRIVDVIMDHRMTALFLTVLCVFQPFWSRRLSS
jgi:hypothetical protein